MKKTLLLLCISLLIANCKSDSGGSDQSSVSTSPYEFISDNILDLGPIAQKIIADDSHINQRFYSPLNPDGTKMYTDMSLFYAVRGYLNAIVKKSDSNGTYDHISADPFSMFLDVTENASTNSQGLSIEGMCYLVADTYEDFGLETRLVYFSGRSHSLFPDGNHCLVEVMIDSSWRVVDPVLNVMYYEQTRSIDCETVLDLIENEGEFVVNPTGYGNAVHGWRDSVDYDTYYHHDDIFYPDEAVDLFDSISDNINFVNYSDLNRG